MQTLTKMIAVSAVALSAAAFAAPTYAAQFASFDHAPQGALSYTNAGQQGSLAVTSAPVEFSFLWPGLTTSGITATFDFTGSIVDPTPAVGTVTPLGTNWLQGDINGTFDFVATEAFTVGGNNFSAGTVLLSGTYTNGWIQGVANSGSENATTLAIGGNVTYASGAIPQISGAIAPRSFAISLNEVTPSFGAAPGQALDSFTADVSGTFSAAGVPEPATWGLMIMGFGGVGALLRNRRRQVATLA